MKRLLLFIQLIAIVSIKAQTSAYHPFPESNACWNFNYTHAQCMFGFGFENFSIIIDGDTTIANLTYHKLFTPYVELRDMGSCTQYNNSGYKGAIRQDISNRKVFFVRPYTSTEQLLYDFNLNIGDTIRGLLSNSKFGTDTVISIDSVLIGNVYHKRWLINNWYGVYLIEGVGSTYGLIEPSPGYIVDESIYNLECFKKNGNPLYPDTLANCKLITNISDNKLISEKVKVFPNPSQGSFTVELDKPNLIDEIILYNVIGKVILYKKTDNQKFFQISNIPQGVYVVSIIGRDNTFTDKKIIICE